MRLSGRAATRGTDTRRIVAAAASVATAATAATAAATAAHMAKR